MFCIYSSDFFTKNERSSLNISQYSQKRRIIRIGPFVHVSEYPFLICKLCKYACVADEVSNHIDDTTKRFRLGKGL